MSVQPTAHADGQEDPLRPSAEHYHNDTDINGSTSFDVTDGQSPTTRANSGNDALQDNQTPLNSLQQQAKKPSMDRLDLGDYQMQLMLAGVNNRKRLLQQQRANAASADTALLASAEENEDGTRPVFDASPPFAAPSREPQVSENPPASVPDAVNRTLPPWPCGCTRAQTLPGPEGRIRIAPVREGRQEANCDAWFLNTGELLEYNHEKPCGRVQY